MVIIIVLRALFSFGKEIHAMSIDVLAIPSKHISSLLMAKASCWPVDHILGTSLC